MTCYIIKYTIKPDNLKETFHYKISQYICTHIINTCMLHMPPLIMLIVVWPNHWQRGPSFLASDLTIPQFMNKCDNPIIIYLVQHFRDVLIILGVTLGLMKAPKDHILAVVHYRKWSDYLRNSAITIICYSNGSMAPKDVEAPNAKYPTFKS